MGTTTFATLREYVIGDELRHVHWRSSAKTLTRPAALAAAAMAAAVGFLRLPDSMLGLGLIGVAGFLAIGAGSFAYRVAPTVDGGTLAPVDQELFIRTEKHLWRVQEPVERR